MTHMDDLAATIILQSYLDSQSKDDFFSIDLTES